MYFLWLPYCLFVMSETEETPPAAATPFMLPPANLPPPKPLVVDDNLASNWKTVEESLATI